MSAPQKSKKKQATQSLQNIKVVVRIRPISSQEEEQRVKSIAKWQTHKEMLLKDKKYNFDKVFKPTATQIELYLNVVAPLIQDVVEGYNCTIFAYGQTGTGKTYTMTGEKCKIKGNWKEDESAGIIPRAAFHIFDELNKLSNVDISVKVSYIELYNEEIRDLLSADENALQMFTDNKGSVSIQGVTETSVHDGEGICKLLQRGIVKRQIAPTLMNHQSSRSHTVFTIMINTRESTVSGEDILKAGKINMVDLAGNENIARSGCNNMAELANINRSLLTLGRVIHALVDKSQKHVPYRDSKLTRILQDSLGGHTKTVIIATISPAHNSYEESASTLEYASRARDIKNTPTINEKQTKHQIIDGLVKEIESLQKDLDAARSGTGFYVDKENYQKLLDAIATVTGETITADEFTSKKAQRIKHLEDLMYSRVREFEKTVDLCKQHEVDLEDARNNLKVNEEILEQERFLSKWYENQTVEKFQEAQRLLNATKTLHSEKEILLAKLEHQFNINVANETVTEKTVTNVANMLDKFGSEETERMKANEEKMKDEFKRSVLDLQTDIASSSKAIRKVSEQCESRINKEENGFSVKSSISNNTSDFLGRIRKKTNVFEEVLSQYDRQLTLLNAEVPKMAANYRSNRQMFLEQMGSLIKSSDNKLKRTVIHRQASKRFENLEIFKNNIISRMEEDKRTVDELQQQIDKLQVNIQKGNTTLDWINKEQHSINPEQDQADECMSERMKDLEILAEEYEQALENCTKLPELITIENVQIQEMDDLVTEFNYKLNEMADLLDKKYEKITQQTIEDCNASIANTCEAIETTLDAKVKKLVINIDVMMGKTEMVDSFTTFMRNIKQVLIEQILEKNIKARHEGDTPQRQSATYPSRLQNVAPRDALIKKFKERTKEKVKEEEELSDNSL